MKTIFKPDPYINAAIEDGKLPPVGTVCRPSLFALPLELNDSKLLFNTFTRQLIDAEDLTTLFTEPHEIVFDGHDQALIELIKARFIVASDANEVQDFTSAIRLMQLLGKKDKKKHGSYVILPTTVCNARCFYCYESGIEYKTMDSETVDALVRYILETKTDGKISIRWFGGEPLIAENVIDSIVSKLNANGVDFSSSMITNASLMTRERAEKAVNEWKVSFVQITFDGRRSEHLKRKAYVDSSNDHFTASLNAAKALCDMGVSVSIRFNADENNIDDLFLLADDLIDIFSGKKNISIYASDMFDDGCSSHSSEANAFLYARIIELHEKLFAAGLLKSDTPRRLRTHRCMVDTPNGSAVVAPDGSLYCCEHMVEASRIGSLWSHENEYELRHKFISDNYRAEKRPECLRCVYIPECTLNAFCQSCHRDCRQNAHSMIFKKVLHFSKNVL